MTLQLMKYKSFQTKKREENYSKPVIVDNLWSNNYIEHESNRDRNKTLSVEEYLNKIRPYLKDIINNLKKSGPWKIQLQQQKSILFLLKMMIKSV